MPSNAFEKIVYQRVPLGPATEATSLAILAAIGGAGASVVTDFSSSGTTERNGQELFSITLYEIGTGPIPVADIDITGIVAVMSKSTGGGAFSAVGITQPVFGKANGLVSVNYQFLAAEWAAGDMYRLQVSGITLTIGLATYFVRQRDWSNTVLRTLDVYTTVNTNLNTTVSSRATQAQILSDATPFPGADVPAIRAVTDALNGQTGVLREQASVAVNINAINAGETDFLLLDAANTRYAVRGIRLKSADPGANEILVRLYELINGALVLTKTFEITTTTYLNYYSLMDMFGVAELYGDNLQITVQASAGGPYAVTGQYSFAKTNN